MNDLLPKVLRNPALPARPTYNQTGLLTKVLRNPEYLMGPHLTQGLKNLGSLGRLALELSPSADIRDAMAASKGTVEQLRRGNLAQAGVESMYMPAALAAIALPGSVGGAKKLLPTETGYKGDPKDALIVHHNIKQHGLRVGEEIGGLPSPSLAVSKVKNPVTNFGEITLIGNPEMAVPKGRNPVWPTDAYTARQPHIEFDLDEDATRFVENRYNVFGEEQHIDADQVYKDLINDDYLDNTDIMAKFFQEKNMLTDDLMEAVAMEPPYYWIPKLKRKGGFDYAEFGEWVEKEIQVIKDSGGEIKKRFFKGFTPSGNRRYAEATLDNLVREMKKGAGQEGWAGAGQLRAQVTPKFRSMKEVKGARDRIVNEVILDLKKSTTGQLTTDLEHAIAEAAREVDPNVAHVTVESLLEDIVLKNPPHEYSKKYLPKMTKEIYEKADVLRKAMKELPTGYFEIKPRRGLLFSEFEGAIVPKELSEKNLDILRKAGIKRIHKYANEKQRTDLFSKFYDKTFSMIPALGLLGLGLQADRDSTPIK